MRYLIMILLVMSSFTSLFAAPNTISTLFSESYKKAREGDTRAALNAVLQVLQKDTRNYTANLRAGYLLYTLGRHNQSIERYQKAVKLAPRAIEPRLGLMLPLMAQRKWATVEEIINNLLKYDPLSYTLNSRLAYIMYVTGRYSEAKSYYNKVAVLYPADLDMQLGLGWTNLKMGNARNAASWFQSVLTVMPTNGSARAGLNALRMKVARR